MPLTSGINHVALVTADLDRLIEFYASVFEAEVVVDMEEGGLRHAMLDLGGGAALHPFDVGDNPHAAPAAGMFQRGHVDHVALDVADSATFETLRARLVERGASDGVVTDFGSVRTVGFTDPDGWEGEVALWQAGPTLAFDARIREPWAGRLP
jgi:catechol 2,3-dioxygenase-like lactoylglutathione lyase family enzyme